jgi:AcrR family transcriptional regulator
MRAESGAEPASVRGRRSAQTRRSVLGAAIELFSEHGCEGTTLRDIAERSGVKQPLILYHFDNKENLWRAAVDEVWVRMEATLMAYAGQHGLAGAGEGEPMVVADLATLRVVLRAFVQSASEHPEYLRILLREASHRGARFDWLVEHHTARNYDMAAALFGSAQARGVLPDVPIHHLVYLLAGALTFIFAVGADVERQTGRDPRSEAFLDAHVDALLRLLVADSG